MTILEMTAAGDVAGLQALAHAPDKETRKAARRGLHILRTRGIDAPVPPAPGAWKPLERQRRFDSMPLPPPPVESGFEDVFDAVMSGRMDARHGVEQLAAAGKLPGIVMASGRSEELQAEVMAARERHPGVAVVTADDLPEFDPAAAPFPPFDPTVSLLALKHRRRRRRDPEEK